MAEPIISQPVPGRASSPLRASTADGSFEGYASLFGKEDMSRDVVLPGAFRSSLRTRGTRGIKLLFQHDANQPIGLWLDLYEDANGLFVRGRLLPEIDRARDVLALMRAGAIDGLSIGFRTLKGRRDRRTGARLLERIDLWEISIVTFPMLAGARVSAIKSDRPTRPRSRDGPKRGRPNAATHATHQRAP